MARTFRRRERPSALSEINVTPLIDLAFALLIIFMITAPLLEQSIELQLPEQASRQPEAAPEERPSRTVSVDAGRRYYWGEETVSAARLRELLAEAAAEGEEPVVHLRADASLPYQEVVRVIDWIEQAGLRDVSLDTRTR